MRTRAPLFDASAIALVLGSSSVARRRRLEIRQGADRDLAMPRSRTRFLGYRVETYKLVVFTLSACMAGIAGALYVPQVGILNPSGIRAGQFDRGRDLGCGRRARHLGRGGTRGGARQLSPRPISPSAARALLAVHAGRFFHSRDLSSCRRGIRLGALLDGCERRRARQPPSPCPGARLPAGGAKVNPDAEFSPSAILYLDGSRVSFDGFTRAAMNFRCSCARRNAPSSARTAPARPP